MFPLLAPSFPPHLIHFYFYFSTSSKISLMTGLINSSIMVYFIKFKCFWLLEPPLFYMPLKTKNLPIIRESTSDFKVHPNFIAAQI